MTLKDLLSDLQNHREALLDRCGDAGGHLRGGVPVEQFNPLAAFDGSVIVERTAGEVSPRCHLPPLCDKRPPEGWPVTRSDPLQLSVLPSRPAGGPATTRRSPWYRLTLHTRRYATLAVCHRYGSRHVDIGRSQLATTVPVRCREVVQLLGV
jgi:hypothetical protein